MTLKFVRLSRYMFLQNSFKLRAAVYELSCAQRRTNSDENNTTGESILHLISAKCMPILLYGLDACPVNVADKRSLDFVQTRLLMKLFNTGSVDIVHECYAMFDIIWLIGTVGAEPETVISRAWVQSPDPAE